MKKSKLPREIWAASVSLKGLWPAATIEQRMKDILQRMESLYPYEPDIICLPETINISWVHEKYVLSEIAEEENTPGPITTLLASIAKNHNCYITCPIITKKDGHFYNSSMLLNRQGKAEGVFHKIHPTSTEIIKNAYYRDAGVTPGPVKSDVINTDFGKVGLQICMDADWADGWHSLKQSGAELVCFSSQGPYTQTLRDHAWRNRYYILSATGEDAQIVDITGDVIASDGEHARWVCASINLEKAFLHTSPNLVKFKDIERKYGRKLRFKIYHAENWATMESLDPEIQVSAILKEFEIPTYDEQLKEAEELQNMNRLSS